MITTLKESRKYIAVLIRLCIALSLVVSVIVAGYLKRSELSVFLFSIVFTILFVLGKFPAWKMAYRDEGLNRLIVSAVISLLIQCVLVSILYCIGYCIGFFLSGDSNRIELSRLDLTWATALLLGGAFLGLMLTILETSSKGD